jgi:hypothetical protein
MAGQARKQGNQPPSGQAPSGHGWARPGYITMPYAANDNRLTVLLLLRQRRFWVWTALILGCSLLFALHG